MLVRCFSFKNADVTSAISVLWQQLITPNTSVSVNYTYHAVAKTKKMTPLIRDVVSTV